MTADGRLLLVRHARTARSGTRQRIGRLDVPLDDAGHRQARQLTGALDALVPRGAPLRIHSSPLVRAQQTIAGFAALRRAPVRLDPDLVEMDFGTADGDPERDRRPRVSRDHLYDPVPDGESLVQVWHRCERFRTRVDPELDAGGSVVVVAHYRVIKLLAGAAAGMDFETAVRAVTLRPANGSVVEVLRPAGDDPVPRGPRELWSPPD